MKAMRPKSAAPAKKVSFQTAEVQEFGVFDAPDLREASTMIKKCDITELLRLNSPPRAVITVCKAAMMLMHNCLIEGNGFVEFKKQNINLMLQHLHFATNADPLDKKVYRELAKMMKDDAFHPDVIKSKSSAAKGLSMWCRAVFAAKPTPAGSKKILIPKEMLQA